jgi:tetratricopeptide (TPR) repeat protein
MKIHHYIAGLYTMMIFVSCEKKLDKINPNSVTTDNYFKTSLQLQKGVNAAYTTLNGSYLVGSSYVWLMDLRADDLVGTTLADERGDILRGALGVNNSYVDRIWRGWYIIIHRCNVVINNTVTADPDDANLVLRDRVVAEAKFLRGLAYFELASLWGGAPLVTKPVTSFDQFSPRASQAEVYAASLKDLQDAAAALPASYAASENGRATSGAANAMLGRVYMQMKDYTNAKIYLEKVRASNVYSLVPNSNWNFDEEHEFNSESVFEVVFSPSPDAAEDEGDDYLYGQYREATSGFRQYDVNTGNGVVLPSPGLVSEFETNDPRRKATIYDVGDTWAGGTMAQQSWKKYTLSYKNPTPGAVANSINRRFIRYAEVLLMLAECENETSNPTGAVARLNDVRSRADIVTAGLSAYPTVQFPCNTKNEITRAIIHEKRVELAGEQIRNRDLLRWREEGKLALAGGDPITYFTANKYELLPVPQSEIDRNLLLGTGGVNAQNPGY